MPQLCVFILLLICSFTERAPMQYVQCMPCVKGVLRATFRLIHFRSCQMGRGPCRAVTLHPTSYCTVTLSVLCHSNEVLLCHKCTIPVQMRSQRAAVPLLVCQLLQAWKRVRPSKLCLGNSLQYISTRSCHTAGNDTSGAD